MNESRYYAFVRDVHSIVAPNLHTQNYCFPFFLSFNKSKNEGKLRFVHAIINESMFLLDGKIRLGSVIAMRYFKGECA